MMMCRLGTGSLSRGQSGRSVTLIIQPFQRRGWMRLENKGLLNIWRSAGDLGKIQSACGLQEIPHAE